MKKSTLYSFSCCTFIAALGSLTIFAHQSQANAPGYASWFGSPAGKRLLSGQFINTLDPTFDRNRQLSKTEIPHRKVWTQVGMGDSYSRGLEATGDGEDASPSNKFHINLKELPSLNCADGCTATFALITSDQCNSTDAQDTALEFTLEEEVTFDTTDMKIDEDAADNGWVTESFRELANKSTNNSTADSSPPISLAEFVTAAAMATELIDAITPNKDYKLAVYLYNNETEPLACATLDLVTEDEELQMYYNLFGGGGEDDEGEDGSDVVEGGAVTAVTNGSSSPLSDGGLFVYAVTGLFAVLSVILFE